MSERPPVTLSLTTDKRSVLGLQDGEIALKFTKVFDEKHAEHSVERLTREELVNAFFEIADYLFETETDNGL